MQVVGARRAYPLGLFIARAFIAERLALIGDAAHMIHPIAGQGLNMGLRDVAALAEAMVDAARLGLDIGGADVLERYQRWRRFDTMTMGVATDGLNRLFSNHSDVLRLVRDIGLGLVERMPALKRMFIREAAGFTGEVPKLLGARRCNICFPPSEARAGTRTRSLSKVQSVCPRLAGTTNSTAECCRRDP